MTTDFSGFGLPPKLITALTRMKFTAPTPIQVQTIPLALAGRDILGSAQTGTGKTGAFGIPLIAKLMEMPQASAIIMTPTRELATQVMAALQQMIPVGDIKTALLIGGESMPKQFSQLRNNPRLIVGTPGRINDHLERRSLNLSRAHFLVLDETDRMLDMGFGIQIDRIVAHLPKERQTMLFSATLPAGIVKVAAKYLVKPERISVGSTTTPITRIKQELVHTSEGDKYQALLKQLGERTGSILVFVKTKHGAKRMAEKLTKSGQHKADAIHGNLKQSKRDRVIADFRDKRFRLLIATDVAARGLDIPHIEHVINYDLPQCPEDYIHRIGRTARAGAEGAAVNLLTPADGSKWRAIHRLMNGGPAEGDDTRQHRNEDRPRGPRREFKGGRGRRDGGGGGGRDGNRPNRSFGDRGPRQASGAR